MIFQSEMLKKQLHMAHVPRDGMDSFYGMKNFLIETTSLFSTLARALPEDAFKLVLEHIYQNNHKHTL